MYKTHTKRYFSVIPFPLISPTCVFILLISTCSMIRSGDNPAQKPVAASHHMVSFHEFPVRIWMSFWQT